MKTADFLDDNLCGHCEMTDAVDLLAAPFAIASPYVDAVQAEECADPEEAYGQHGQDILEKPGFDELRRREHTSEDCWDAPYENEDDPYKNESYGSEVD